MPGRLSRRELLGRVSLAVLAGQAGCASGGADVPGALATGSRGHGAQPEAAQPEAAQREGVRSEAAQPEAARAAAARLVAAWDEGDRTGFVAALGSEAVRAESLWDGWRALSSVRLVADPAPAGDGGVGVRVHWRVAGEQREVVDTVVVHGGTPVRLAPGPGARPVWFDHRIESVVAGGASLLVAPGLPDAVRAAWLAAASEAVDRLRHAPLAPWLDGWDGVLVLVVPADALDFARTAGLASGIATTAAVTVQPTPDAAPRVVLNPDALGLSGNDRVGLLVHEGVHAVTGSAARWPAPQWLAEGLAESVACGDDPARGERNVALALRGGGVPVIDAAQPPDEAAYARAQVAYEGCVARWGRGVLHGWLTQWDASHPGDAEIAAAYDARLLSLR